MEKYIGGVYDSDRLNNPLSNDILVFGSNTQGRHGKGSALFAKEKFGAVYGQSKGRQGNSYAICTKDLTVRKHPSVQKETIMEQIQVLYSYAAAHPELNFLIVYSGVGENLNAYSNIEMADMFKNAFFLGFIPSNILFQETFLKLMYNEI